MPRLFVGNFDFEHELADPHYTPPPHVRRITAELTTSWITIADADDAIWLPESLPEFGFDEFRIMSGIRPRFIHREAELPHGLNWELVPWGWTPSVLKWGQRFGWSCPAPPMSVVKLVNNRTYRWELESRLQVALPGSAVLTSIEQLAAHVEGLAANAGWVLKANFGMSGRERQLGRGPEITASILNWVKRRLLQSSAVVFEPWLERTAEAGIQIEIPIQGDPVLLGVLPLLTDPTGTYRGSRIQGHNSELDRWRSAGEIALQIAQEVQRSGYFGPLGIDAMQYRDREGKLQMRPLQDLNARYTMGRLGLGLRRFVAHNGVYDWLHDARLVTQSVAQITNRSWLARR